MDYTEVKISITPFSQQAADITAALLAEIGFDSFAEGENELNAYIPTQHFDRQKLEHTLNTTAFSSTLSYSLSAIEDQNMSQKSVSTRSKLLSSPKWPLVLVTTKPHG